MQPRLTPAAQPTTRERIAALEGELALRFPSEYVELLLATNGGEPAPDAYGGPVRAGSVDTFFAVDASKAHHDLREVALALADLLPPRLLPIAHDYDGNVLCLSCGGEDAGRVYLWDEAHDATTLVARSFAEWWDSFTPAEPAEDEIVRAIRDADPDALRRLLDDGLSADAEDRYGFSLLRLAALLDRAPLVPLLLERGADPEGAVAVAVGAGHRDLACLLLDRGAPIHGALTAAAATGRSDLFDLLLERGAKVDEQVDEIVGTPLMIAAGNGRADLVEALLARGADPHARSGAGQTAVDRARHHGHDAVIAALIRATADPD